jgi:hypothetical protein
VRTRVGLSNQLRSIQQVLYPGAAQIFADIDSPDRPGVPASISQ